MTIFKFKCTKCKKIKSIGGSGIVNPLTMKQDIVIYDSICDDCWPKPKFEWKEKEIK